jgi:CRP-like cAMP-binding protein
MAGFPEAFSVFSTRLAYAFSGFLSSSHLFSLRSLVRQTQNAPAAVDRDEGLRRLLLLYQNVYHSQVLQTAACNGLHTVRQRCSRWLLMTHDRVQTDKMPLTHEFLAITLGVRRPSVTEVLGPLQDEGMVRSGRGTITVLNRTALEATACECSRRVNQEYQRLLG